VDVLRTALTRGAFEFQGQKCSAASRAYIPRSVWSRLRDGFLDEVNSLSMGDITDFSHFMGAVIDQRSFDRLAGVLERVRGEAGVDVLAGGTAEDTEDTSSAPPSCRPTTRRTRSSPPSTSASPGRVRLRRRRLRPGDRGGSPRSRLRADRAVIAQDRAAIVEAMDVLRFSAGNFYINDKPTGAVVGQQPFGGARASGTNDKAGSILNLLRGCPPGH
jgi:1-pyrroline-5-carboxylate dehydrogenase